jgi:hypothetical protein
LAGTQIGLTLQQPRKKEKPRSRTGQYIRALYSNPPVLTPLSELAGRKSTTGYRKPLVKLDCVGFSKTTRILSFIQAESQGFDLGSQLT